MQLASKVAFAAGLVFVLAACSSPSSGDPAAPDSAVDIDSSPVDSFGDPFDGPAPFDSTVDAAETDGSTFSDHLSATTLYADFKSKTVRSDLIEFSPAYALWSDNAVKHRWLQLPPGTKIDTSDMDNWKFPIGSKFWKEFRLQDGTLLETRLIERTGESSYRFGSYVWKADASDAIYTEAGAANINGTDWNVPDLGQCQGCHLASPGRINGFQAVQLSKPGPGTNLRSLADKGLLSNPPPAGVMYPVPGNAVESAALGYLHANCGHCHNPNWTFFTVTDQVLRLTIADRDVATSGPVMSTVYGRTKSYHALPFRIVPGDSTNSAVIVRMGHRGDGEAMPPIGSKKTDPTGIAAVKTWIDSLPKSPPPDAGVDGSSDAGPPDVGDASPD